MKLKQILEVLLDSADLLRQFVIARVQSEVTPQSLRL